MGKRRPTISPRKLRNLHSDRTFRPVRRFEYSELNPILNKILDKQTDDKLRVSLTNYLIIRSVSIFEYYLGNKAHQLVDKADLDISSLFNNKDNAMISRILRLEKGKITKGKIVSMSYSFANPRDVNTVFSKLLNIRFFDEVKAFHKMEDDMNETFRYYDGAIELCKNWNRFFEIIDLRNSIVHGMASVKLSNRAILSFVDSLMVFLDTAGPMCEAESDYVYNLKENKVSRLKST